MYRETPDDKTPHVPHPRPDAEATRRDQCPVACTGCPDDCLVCNPPEPRHMCSYCGWTGPKEAFAGGAHDCANAPDEPEPIDDASYEIPTPRVAQLTIELLNRIGLHPLDPHHVIRHDDGALVPVSSYGVMDVLNKPLDQETAAAIAAELAYRTRAYVRGVAAGSVIEVACAQHYLRRYATAVTR